jgi:glycosyltransferase involved in cell wall biosynthesis
MKNQIYFSIIINNYNYGYFLSQAIDSALNQDYPYKEVIVVDDGSTDNSRSVMQNYGDKIISVFKSNGGQASAFNAGFEKSSGDVICFLDSDDAFELNKLSRVAHVFESNSHIEWCFHSLRLIRLDTEKCIDKAYKKHGHAQRTDFNDLGKAKPKKYPATSGTCFTRSCLSNIFPMPEDINIVSDNYIKFVVTSTYRGCVLDEELAEQKIHSRNAYTLNPNYHYLKPKYDVLIAYWARIRFPNLSTSTDRLLSSGIAGFWKVRKLEPDSSALIRSYLEAVGRKRRLKIYAKTFYEIIKLVINKFMADLREKT